MHLFSACVFVGHVHLVVQSCLCSSHLSLHEFEASLSWQLIVRLVVGRSCCYFRVMHYKEQRGRHELHIPVYFNPEKSDKNWSKLEGKICWQEKRSLALTVLEIQYGIFQACEKEGLKVEMCHSWSDCTTHRKKEVIFFILKGCLGPCLEREAEPQVISEGLCA